MIIKEISITNFGGSHNVRIPEITNGINLFFGYNEAGKSTILNFIKYMLFNVKYPDPLNNKKPEGHITFLENKMRYKLLRSGRKSKQLINLKTGEDITNRLEQFIVIDNTIFSNVFGMGVDDIAKIDKSGKAQINSIIADSAFNIGHKKPSTAIEEIKKEYEVYWKPRARCKIREVINTIKEKGDLLKESGGKVEEYSALMKKAEVLRIELRESKTELIDKETEYKNLSKRFELKKALTKIESIDIDSERYEKITEGDDKLVENDIELSREKSEKINNIHKNIDKLNIEINSYDTVKFALLKEEDLFFRDFYLKFKENSDLSSLIDQKERLSSKINGWIEQNAEVNMSKKDIYNIRSAPFFLINGKIREIKLKKNELNSINNLIESNNRELNRNNKALENLRNEIKNFKLNGQNSQKIENLLKNIDSIENRINDSELTQLNKIDLDKDTIENVLSAIDKLSDERERLKLIKTSIDNLEKELGVKISLPGSYENIDEESINEFIKKKNRIDELNNFNTEELEAELYNAHNNLEKNRLILTRIKHLQEQKRYEKETADITENLFYSSIGDINPIKKALNDPAIKNSKKADSSLLRWNILSYTGISAAILSFAFYLYFDNIPFAAVGFLSIILFIISFYLRRRCKKQLILRDKFYKDFNLKEDINIFDRFFIQELQKIEKNRQIIKDLDAETKDADENTNIEEINNALITSKINIKDIENKLKTKRQSADDYANLEQNINSYLKDHNIAVIDKHKPIQKIYKLNKLNTVLSECKNVENSINLTKAKIENLTGGYYDEDIQKLKITLKNMDREWASYKNKQKEIETLNYRLKQYLSELQDIFGAFSLKDRDEYLGYMQKYNKLQQNIDKISDLIENSKDKSREFSEKRLNLEQIIDKDKESLKKLCGTYIKPLKMDYNNMEISEKVTNEYLNDIVPKLDNLYDVKKRIEKIEETRNNLIDKFSAFIKQYFPQKTLCNDFKSCRKEADIVMEKLKELKEEKRQFDNKKSELQALINNRKELENEFNTLREQISAILQKASASNEFEFKSKYNKEMENRKNISIKNRMINDLNLSKNYDDVKLELAEETTETLEYKITSLKNNIDKIGNEIMQKEKELSSCETEIKNLIDIEDMEKLNSEVEALKKQLKEMVYEQDVKNISMAILKNAQEQYIEKSQPRILRTASDFLSRLTGGRYSQIIFETQNDIFAKDEKDGLRKDLNRLSKGTLQQMFFAIRIAIAIDRNSKLNISYPVIFDDIFVNFDEYRMKNAILILLEIAEKHNMQFLIFTCHKFIHDMVSQLGTINNIPLEV